MASFSAVVPQRPSFSLLGLKPLPAAIEFVSYQFNSLPKVPQGDGHSVTLFPGLGSDGTPLISLLNHCQELGYDALDWGRRFNTGPSGNVDAWLAGLSDHVNEPIGDSHQSASLIGWGLGGLYAREVGKRLSPRVRQVITIGSPFNGAADITNAGWPYSLLSGSTPKPDDAQLSRLRTPPPVPTTSIFSSSDGVVAWQFCVHGKPARRVEDVEVGGSHIGKGLNNAAFAVVADCLSQKPGKWRPYVATSASE